MLLEVSLYEGIFLRGQQVLAFRCTFSHLTDPAEVVLRQNLVRAEPVDSSVIWRHSYCLCFTRFYWDFGWSS